jgi:thiol:disulfide interchange protein DsbD
MKLTKKWLITLFIFLTLLTPALSSANPQPLLLNKAFQFTATAKDYQTVVLQWSIAPGYYLYRDRFKIRAVNPGKMRLAEPILPYDSIEKDFPPLGKFAVYDKNIYIIQPIINSNNESITLQVSYQGCSEKGFCYPPVSKVVTVNLSGNYMIPVKGIEMDVAPEPQLHAHKPVATMMNPQEHIAKILSTKNWWGIAIGFFIFGVLISFTPCVLPMIPILSSIIVGQGKISHARSFTLSLLYVLGMAITYAIAGVIFGFIGGSIQADFQKPWLISIFVAIFILMALSLFGLYDLQLPEKWRSKLANVSNHQKRGTLIGVIFMGIFSTLVLSPCVTPPLVGVLAYISQSGDAAIGGIALFIMGIGMGLPLLLIGAFGPKLIPHTGKWMVAVKNFMGVLMLAVAIWMLSRIIPDIATMMLWGILILGCGVTLGALSTVQGHWQHIRKAIGLVLFVYGIVIIVGASLGNTDPFQPLANQKSVAHKNELNFITVKTIDDVYHQMNLPENKNKPVVIDFYADWCIACKEMDHVTFSNEQVQAALKGFLFLRADVTTNDMNAKALEQHFNVVAPPTVLFFNNKHQEVKNARVVGMTKPTAFLERINETRNSTN